MAAMRKHKWCLQAGQTVHKRGRPTKGYVELHTQVKPVVKAEIARKAKEFGISQGEVIEYLWHLQEIKADLEQHQVELKQELCILKEQVAHYSTAPKRRR
jgi:hypothetical protein